ncbi:sigma-70 family RNA polymerase sigma factor [Fimbriiglobus ruber]|uniref:Glycine-rich protein n=1 Tax=Fimbriiglobus ruber TaxID=1908690 RepID=A0A225EA11_9BACT|nr:sigma-70 family RNA polymerase sigma factor [Fimbriiglobus ruber]OWK45257.1 glycine-rich protein [Fimbriiglobus ruber]
MNRSLLATVFRHADKSSADRAAGVPDGELLRRFVADRNEDAFAEIVRRHGPMVWAACRHQLPNGADAEDAFQVTFLALVRSPWAVREGAAVGGWLHRVAVRAALKVRRAATRRRLREERAAGSETDRPVPDSTWDTLLAAVHEEVERLPTSLRAAFVLCDLEGVRPADAAARLGWKPGTLSGRLARARQQLLDRLTQRGLAPAAAAGGLGLMTATATAAVPTRLTEQVVSFAGAAGALPGAVAPAILELAKEIVPMTLNRIKLLAAAALVVAGLATGTGAILLPSADAQAPVVARPTAPPAPPATPAPPAQPGMPPTPPTPPTPGMGMGMGMGGPPAFAFGHVGHAKWEYKFVAGGFPAKDFIQLFTDLGNDGWEFCGYWEMAVSQLADALKAHPDKIVVRPGSSTTLIFKRAVQPGPEGRWLTVSGAGMAPPRGAMPGMPPGMQPGMPGMMGGSGIGTPPGMPGGPGGPGMPGTGMMGGMAAGGVGGAGGAGGSGGTGGGGGASGGGGAGGGRAAGTSTNRPQGNRGGGWSWSETSSGGQNVGGGLQIVNVKHAEAQDLVETLTQLYGGPWGGGAKLQVVVDKHTSALILRGDAETLKEAEELIKKLDVPSGKPTLPPGRTK